ncbi:MAG: OmpA family protein [Marinobacter sp.]|uniref:flagellar protein MotY n=1 Tax=Marinobacter sp. TaxID=50741 RepID=UPI0034A01870
MIHSFFSRLPAILALTLVSGSAWGIRYGAGIENSQWYLSESVFDCTLTHEVPSYGKAVFRHQAGAELSFYLESHNRLMRPGRGLLVVEAPAWRPGSKSRPVGYIDVDESHRPVTLDARRSMIMISGLLEGMAPTLTRRAWYSDEPIRISLSNINFARSFEGYRGCVASLLPVNFDQIKRSRIPFNSGSTQLSSADYKLLDSIVLYVQADSTVERVFVDGHSDSVGSRINNRALSEQRANIVAEYLIEQGIPKDRVTVRAHGDQFPASRRAADNRRTTIRLQRQGERPALQRANSAYAEDANG